MIKQAYVIYDSKAESYNDPIYFFNDAMAERAARQVIEDGDHLIRSNPEDFTLFNIGEYNGETGEFHPRAEHKVVVRFHELRQPKLEEVS